MVTYKKIKDLESLKDFILFGDTHKVPLDIVKPKWKISFVADLDEVQTTKIEISAVIDWLIFNNYELFKKNRKG